MTGLQTFLSDFNILTSPVSVIFQIGSRSLKPDHFLPLSKWCFHASLVRTHQSVFQTEYKAHFCNPSPMATLKIEIWSPNLIIFFPFPNLWYTKFGVNPSIDSAEELLLVQIWHSKCIWDLEKKGQGHHHITSYPFLDDRSTQVWSESTHLFSRQSEDKAQFYNYNHVVTLNIWAAPSEFGTYRLCEQRRFRRACASAQSRQNLRCSLIQAVSQEEPSDRKPDP